MEEFLKMLISIEDGQPHLSPNLVRLRYKLELPSGDGIISADTKVNRCQSYLLMCGNIFNN